MVRQDVLLRSAINETVEGLRFRWATSPMPLGRFESSRIFRRLQRGRAVGDVSQRPTAVCPFRILSEYEMESDGLAWTREGWQYFRL
jgi:hypothetical protein